MAVFDLIDFSQPKPQIFSLSKPLIYYIFYNSRLPVFKELIRSCKALELLNVKTCQLDELHFYDKSWEIKKGELTSKASNGDFCGYKVDAVTGSIKILNSFKLLAVFHGYFYISTLLPKLDLSDVKIIYVSITEEIGQDILEKFLPPSIEKFDLTCHSCKNANPALLAFQRCPKLKSIQIFLNSIVPVITKNVLKEMVQTVRENKIEQFIFYSLSEIDTDDFINLIENHLAPKCDIFLSTMETKVFNHYEHMFDKVKKIRQRKSNDNIMIRFWYNEKVYKKFL